MLKNVKLCILLQLKQQIAEQAEALNNDQIGFASLAATFAKLLPLARITKQAEFVEILQKHKDLHNQLVDLLGAVQSIEAHNAILEVFPLNEADYNADWLEKYLQSLAVGTHPDRAIIEDLLKILKTNDETALNDEKLKDTVLQTLASLTHQMGFEPQESLLQQIRSYILDQLVKKCPEDDASCETRYIRALQNLQDVNTIPVLLETALKASSKASVAAMQALRSFPVERFSERDRALFAQIFFQHQRKYDTSARTVAFDILLALKPTKEQLGQFLEYLGSNDRHYEIKTYVIQKLKMLSEKCPRFNALLRDCLHERPKINNYHVIGQKGLFHLFNAHNYFH